MAELKQNPDDPQLHWFWKITTKWWFFPVFYVIIGSTFFIKNSPKNIIPLHFLLFLILAPSGILFYFNMFMTIQGLWLSYVVSFISYLFIIFSYFLIQYYNSKKKILKWLIIVLLFYIIISFVGCVKLSHNIDF